MQKFEITEEQFKILIQYLGSRPYKEVHNIVSFMLNLSVIEANEDEEDESVNS